MGIVTRAGNDYRVQIAGADLICNKEEMLDLAYAACKAVDLEAVADEDMKKMTNAIDESMAFKEVLQREQEKSEVLSVPIVGTTTSDNEFKGYTGSNIPTETLMELNKGLKEHP